MNLSATEPGIMPPVLISSTRSIRHTLAVEIVAVLAVALFPSLARASFMNQGTTEMPETFSWSEPTKITLFLDSSMSAADRASFQMGVNVWADLLSKIDVMFKVGATDGKAGSVAVEVVPKDSINNGNSLGSGGPTDVSAIPQGQTHGSILQGSIEIDKSALGMANLIKNLGAHEFGHVLGLADDDRSQGNRVNVMDSDFTADDGFASISASDKTMVKEHYMTVPEPATVTLLALGGVMLANRRRRAG